tara:strand:- start:20 stop:694 length:675 start_codon:yes stop_codon:yes gene_type:complete
MKLFNDFIFIVPARKGSKGIKDKNIIKIKNKYLVEHSFKILGRIPKKRKYVISDSNKIKKIAKKYEINTNYFRSKKLSRDHTTLIENLCHFDKFIDQNLKFKHYVILQPTSPLRCYKDLLNSIKKYLKDKSESLFSVSLSLEHPNDSIFLRNNKIQFFHKKQSTLRQNYKKSYFINGAIYIFNRKLLKYKKIISRKKHSIFEMPKKRSIDLDDYQDYELIKKLL